MNWNTYRYIGLNPVEAAYYEGWYMIKNVIKYTNIKISGGVTQSNPHRKIYCVIRSGSAVAPNWLRKFMLEKVLRKLSK